MKIYPHNLDRTASSLLARGGPVSVWNDIKWLIQTGQAGVFRTENDSYLVLGMDQNYLFIYACTGRAANQIMQTLIQAARRNKLLGVKFRTVKPGLLRLLSGFHITECGNDIYKVDIQ